MAAVRRRSASAHQGFVILVDHLRYAVNPLYDLSGHQARWVTVAEGFVLDRALAAPWLARGVNLAVVALVWLLVRNRVVFRINPR